MFSLLSMNAIFKRIHNKPENPECFNKCRLFMLEKKLEKAIYLSVQ